MTTEILPATRRSLDPKKPVAENVSFQLTPEQSRRVKKINAYHAACIKTFNQQMGYAFLTGMEIDGLKEDLKHGQFEKVCDKLFPKINERTRRRYHKFFTEVKDLKLPQKGHGVSLLIEQGSAVNGKGKLSKECEKAVLAAVHEIADGKSLTEMYRDLGVIRKPTPDGGFRPNEEAVQAWLKEHHPQLAGTKYADLPADIQKAFKKQYRPALPESLKAETRRERMMLAAKEFSAAFDDGCYAECDEKERAEIVALCSDVIKKVKPTLK